jgi:hypothetical protein
VQLSPSNGAVTTGGGTGVTAILSILYMVLILVLLTCGAALLLHFWARHLPQGVRIFLGAVLGPGSLLLYPMLLGVAYGGFFYAEIGFGFFLIGLLTIGLVGFPTAFLATRKLDRDLPVSADIFQ